MLWGLFRSASIHSLTYDAFRFTWSQHENHPWEKSRWFKLPFLWTESSCCYKIRDFLVLFVWQWAWPVVRRIRAQNIWNSAGLLPFFFEGLSAVSARCAKKNLVLCGSKSASCPGLLNGVTRSKYFAFLLCIRCGCKLCTSPLRYAPIMGWPGSETATASFSEENKFRSKRRQELQRDTKRTQPF